MLSPSTDLPCMLTGLPVGRLEAGKTRLRREERTREAEPGRWCYSAREEDNKHQNS